MGRRPGHGQRAPLAAENSAFPVGERPLGLGKTDDRRHGQGSKHLFAGLQEGCRSLDDDRKHGRRHLDDDRKRKDGWRHLFHDRDNRVWERRGSAGKLGGGTGKGGSDLSRAAGGMRELGC